MKRLAFALSLSLILAIVSPCLSLIAQSENIPHENPLAAESSSYPQNIMVSYGKIFQIAAMSQYQDAQSMLKEMDFSNIPPEWKHITDNYNVLSRQLVATLNDAESKLYEASRLFSEDNSAAAVKSLDETESILGDAKSLLTETEAATEILTQTFSILLVAENSKLESASNTLKASLQSLNGLIEKLGELRKQMRLHPEEEIETGFQYTTLLELSAPANACPGLPINLSGNISSDGEPTARKIQVFIDDELLYEGTVPEQFTFKVTPPPKTPNGKHSLIVSVASQEKYASASQARSINILRMPLQADINIPNLVIVPNPFPITGNVSHNLTPVAGARDNLEFNNITTTVETNPDGSYTAETKRPRFTMLTPLSANILYATPTTVDLPFDLSLAGPQQITITIDPLEPWYAPVYVKKTIYAINPVNISLIFLIFISAGLVINRRFIKRTKAFPKGNKIIPQEEAQTGIFNPAPGRNAIIQTGISTAYESTLETVEKVTGIIMATGYTLREFYDKVRPCLKSARKPFKELTDIAEKAFYSARTPDDDTVKKAGKIAGDIKKELDDRPA